MVKELAKKQAELLQRKDNFERRKKQLAKEKKAVSGSSSDGDPSLTAVREELDIVSTT